MKADISLKVENISNWVIQLGCKQNSFKNLYIKTKKLSGWLYTNKECWRRIYA